MNLLTVLLALALQDVPAPTLDAIDHAALDAAIAEYEGENKPGFTSALCRDGEVIWTNSCGEASLEWGVPNDRDTVYRLASTSKQFTAAAIHLLALDGKLELDAPLAKYMPEFSGLAPMPTVRQMVQHTSGIRDYLSLMSFMGYDFNGQFEVQEVLDTLLLQKGLNFDPGTDWSYSNSNYVLLALMVERVSEQDLAEFTRERIFIPLGMTSTLWLNDVDRVIPNRAWGYEPDDESYRRSETRIEILGDGALASTVVDLAKWSEMLIDPPKEWATLVAEMLDGTLLPGEGSNRYGAGLVIDTFHNLPRIQHGGAFAGFRCQMAHLPEQNLTAICLANNGQFNPDSVVSALLESALGDSLPKTPKPEPVAEEAEEEESPEARKERRALRKAKARRPSTEEAAGIIGSYACPELRIEFTIELNEKNRLQVRKSDGNVRTLRLRRETGEAITHGFFFGVHVDLDFTPEGRLTGGIMESDRARGMRILRTEPGSVPNHNPQPVPHK